MNKIISKEHFSEKVFKLVIEAPLIAKSRKAGHFVIVRVGEKGERMPLTIAEADPVKGTITLVVQEVGLSSTRLCELNEGDYITDVVGPLGQATHIDNFGTVVCAGGGVGVAPMLPIVQALKAAGNRVITVLAGRTKELIILEKEMRESSDGRRGGSHQAREGRQMFLYRPRHHDEICLFADKEIRNPHGCIPEYDYGRWYRHVWSLPNHHRRKDQIRMRGWS